MNTANTFSSFRRDLLAGSAIVLLILTGSACAEGGSEAAGGDVSDHDGAATNAQAVEFAACMRANGVRDFPDPDASGNFDYGITVSGDQWTGALQACHDLQPAGSFSGDRTAEQQSAALLFAQCIRDNGVSDFPDPVDGEPLVDTNRIPSTSTEDGMAILNAALEACRELSTAAIEGGR